jgi:hypothetical protein
MTDYFLKFLGQQQALEVMQPFTYTDDEGITHLSQGGHQWALWEVSELNGYEGWHVNLRMIDEEIDVSYLEPYFVHPKQPKCVWA